jgi:hypothetical protein
VRLFSSLSSYLYQAGLIDEVVGMIVVSVLGEGVEEGFVVIRQHTPNSAGGAAVAAGPLY